MTLPVVVASLGILLVTLALAQLPYAILFMRALRRPGAQGAAPATCPPALVLLPVRGSDPSLGACVEGLLNQDYPAFDLCIVVDGEAAEAGEVVEQAIAAHPGRPVRVEALRERLHTCSLKCSALLQGLGALEPDHAFVAQVDADAVPHPTWLRELAGGFVHPGVGAVTGNRWYRPPATSLGALARYLWNAAAVPLMTAHRIPWGGTMAVRADLVRSGEVARHWRVAFGDDTSLAGLLRDAGLRLHFVSSLLMVDAGPCSVDDFRSWLERQLLSARLNHPAWPAVFAHGALTSAALAALIVVGGVTLAAGAHASAVVALAGLAVYQLVLLAALALMERRVGTVLGGRRGGVATTPAPSLLSLRLGVALVLAQAAHGWVLARVPFMRTVVWRGVSYEIVSRGRIRREGSS